MDTPMRKPTKPRRPRRPHKPKPAYWTDGAYDVVTNIQRYMMRKRTVKCVILDDKLLPMPCRNPKCEHGGIVTVENGGNGSRNQNRTDLVPKNKTRDGQVFVCCQHYDCSWETTLAHLYGPFYDKVIGR